MKRLPGIKVTIIVAMLMFLSGCINDQYAIEKKYWQSMKYTDKIFKNPEASPPNEVERVVDLLKDFIRQYPDTKLSVEAEFNISRIYAAKEDYDKSRAQLRMIMNKYNKVDAVCSEALFLIGTTYQLQDNWASALEQYKKIMATYPLTLKGLDVPVYIAQYYRLKHQPDKMIAAYRDAVVHFQGITEKYPPQSPVVFVGYKMIAHCYLAIKDWQKAVTTYQAMIEKFEGKVVMDDILLDMGLIYKRELKDEIKAKDSLEALLKQYPKSRFSKVATAVLREIDKK